MFNRKILHVDQNCFYASVEMKKNPALRDVPMAVGGDVSLRHGIILAKNYLASSYGVKTAETIWQAKSKCPDLVIVPPCHQDYQFYSVKLFELYTEYTSKVESFGLDECWLDISNIANEPSNAADFSKAEKIAREIQHRVTTELGLDCSIGLSFNKIFSKLGSDFKKPRGLTVITPSSYQKQLFALPVESLLSVGKVTKYKLAKINIRTIGQLAEISSDFLRAYLGKTGGDLWRFANGRDTASVSEAEAVRPIKSVGNSITTPQDLRTEDQVWQVILKLSHRVSRRLAVKQLEGKFVQIYIRDSCFLSLERQKMIPGGSNEALTIAKAAMDLFRENYVWQQEIRTLGVRCSGIQAALQDRQISFFDKV